MSPSAQPHDNSDGGGSSAPSSQPPREAGDSEISGPQTQRANPRAPRTEQELAQAFRDLARGEQAATALEVNLTNLESKLDRILASFESIAADTQAATNGNGQESPDDGHNNAGSTAENGQNSTHK